MTVCFRKERSKWRYDFIIDGRRHVGYCIHPETGKPAETKSEAKDIESLIRADVLRHHGKDVSNKQNLGGHDYPFAMACVAYKARVEGDSYWKTIKFFIPDLLAFFGQATPVSEVQARVWDYISWARKKQIMVYIGKGRPLKDMLKNGVPMDLLFRPCKSGRTRSDSTINRYLDCLRQILKIAYESRDGSGRRLLAEPPQVPDLKEPMHLPRPISDEDLSRIIEKAPSHLGDAILLARYMGFRKAEIFSLTIGQIDFNNRGVWLQAEETKGNRAEFVPANEQAMDLLRRLVKQANERGIPYLIAYRHGSSEIDAKGNHRPWRQVKNPKRAWRTALASAGLTGQHTFHNTKASFVTAVAHVASAAVTQKLARHKDYRTTERYLKVCDSVARTAVEAIPMQMGPALKSHPAVTPAENFGGSPATQVIGKIGRSDRI